MKAVKGKSDWEKSRLPMKNQSDRKKRVRDEGKRCGSGEFDGGAGGGGERTGVKRRRKESVSDESDDNLIQAQHLRRRRSILVGDRVNRIVDSDCITSDVDSYGGNGKAGPAGGQRSSIEQQSKCGSRLPVSCFFFIIFGIKFI